MELETALAAARGLRDAMANEMVRARHERQLLRRLDGAGLLARAAERSGFLAEVDHLERTLAAALGQAASSLGPGELTLDRLRASAPGVGPALADALSEVRAMAGALHELDALNRELARRALAVVRGHAEALRPTPSAYDRRGARLGAPALSVVSSEG